MRVSDEELERLLKLAQYAHEGPWGGNRLDFIGAAKPDVVESLILDLRESRAENERLRRAVARARAGLMLIEVDACPDRECRCCGTDWMRSTETREDMDDILAGDEGE